MVCFRAFIVVVFFSHLKVELNEIDLNKEILCAYTTLHNVNITQKGERLCHF